MLSFVIFGVMKKGRIIRILKKLHKWPAIVIAFIAILFAVSGIVMNHRSLFSSVDVSRKLLPANYSYSNWNLAAVRGSAEIDSATFLVFGNIGIWKTDRNFKNFEDFNEGFPKGIDNRKISNIAIHKNRLFAGTHMGLYSREMNGSWEKIELNVKEDRIADVALKEDTLLVLTRHYLLKSADGNRFETIQLPEPVNYERKTGLFNTFWELHSGELFGLPGKLLVDLLGLVTIFLSVTGLLHFFFPKLIRRRKKKGNQNHSPSPHARDTSSNGSKVKTTDSLIKAKKSNLHWHNVIGYVFVLFLLINTFSGMHLRPPLLIAIATKNVGIIPGTHLDSPNPWFDKLRRVQWDENLQRYIFSTSDGFFYAGETLKNKLQPFQSQPPVSVMGCNVLKPVDENIYLVGSFSGMFLWNIENGVIADFFTRQPHVSPEGLARPIAENMAAGWVEGGGNFYWFDYNRGAIPLTNVQFGKMDKDILKKSPLSLWNTSLEIHTGRIFENILGPFYILFVPLSGICIMLVLISGFFIWWMVYRKSKPGSKQASE